MTDALTNEPDPINVVVSEIAPEAATLRTQGNKMLFRHQFFTVATILLGVSAPAIVTYTLPDAFKDYEIAWKVIAIIVTALATASATIRTVLRYADRYSNCSLTAIALEDLIATLRAKQYEVIAQVKDEYKQMKLFEFASWGRKEMYSLKRQYVEKEVAATAKEKLEFATPPAIQTDQKVDPAKKPWV